MKLQIGLCNARNSYTNQCEVVWLIRNENTIKVRLVEKSHRHMEWIYAYARAIQCPRWRKWCVCVLWRSTFQRKWLATTTMNLHDSPFWLKHDADCITGLMLWLIDIVAGIVTIRRFVAKCEKTTLDSLAAIRSSSSSSSQLLESLTHHVIDVWFVCTLSLFWFVRNCRRSWHVRRVRTDPTVTYKILVTDKYLSINSTSGSSSHFCVFTMESWIPPGSDIRNAHTSLPCPSLYAFISIMTWRQLLLFFNSEMLPFNRETCWKRIVVGVVVTNYVDRLRRDITHRQTWDITKKNHKNAKR